MFSIKRFFQLTAKSKEYDELTIQLRNEIRTLEQRNSNLSEKADNLNEKVNWKK